MDQPGAARDQLFAQLEPRPAPADLRPAVLAAARAALAHSAPLSWWQRAWHSRPARIAWATAVALLILAHLALSWRRWPGWPGSGTGAGPQPGTDLHQAWQMERLVDLPRIDAEALAAIERRANLH